MTPAEIRKAGVSEEVLDDLVRILQAVAERLRREDARARRKAGAP